MIYIMDGKKPSPQQENLNDISLSHVGLKIEQYRIERDLTQEELGEQLGVTNKTISKWENGELEIEKDMLPLIAKIFGVEINDLIDEPIVRPKRKSSVMIAIISLLLQVFIVVMMIFIDASEESNAFLTLDLVFSGMEHNIFISLAEDKVSLQTLWQVIALLMPLVVYTYNLVSLLLHKFQLVINIILTNLQNIELFVLYHQEGARIFYSLVTIVSMIFMVIAYYYDDIIEYLKHKIITAKNV